MRALIKGSHKYFYNCRAKFRLFQLLNLSYVVSSSYFWSQCDRDLAECEICAVPYITFWLPRSSLDWRISFTDHFRISLITFSLIPIWSRYVILQQNKAMQAGRRELDPWVFSNIQNGKRALTVKPTVSVSLSWILSAVRCIAHWLSITN